VGFFFFFMATRNAERAVMTFAWAKRFAAETQRDFRYTS
jgi:hypothetical protein